MVPGREAGSRRARTSGAGPAGGARTLLACVELGGCRRGGGGGGGTAGGGPGSGNMSGEWWPCRCHPPGGAAAAARSRPCVPTPCGLPQGRSQAAEPWPLVSCTVLTFPGLELLSLRPFIDSQLLEHSLLPSPSQTVPAPPIPLTAFHTRNSQISSACLSPSSVTLLGCSYSYQPLVFSYSLVQDSCPW